MSKKSFRCSQIEINASKSLAKKCLILSGAMFVAYLLLKNQDEGFDILLYLSIGSAAQGVYALAEAVRKQKVPYLKIAGDFLIKNTVIPEKIKLSEVTGIRKFSGDYIITFPKTEKRIAYDRMDEANQKLFEATVFEIISS